MAAKYAPESSKAANPPFDCTSHALSGRHGALAKYKPLLYALLYQNLCIGKKAYPHLGADQTPLLRVDVRGQLGNRHARGKDLSWNSNKGHDVAVSSQNLIDS
jgi:hypothetical protein